MDVTAPDILDQTSPDIMDVTAPDILDQTPPDILKNIQIPLGLGGFRVCLCGEMCVCVVKSPSQRLR